MTCRGRVHAAALAVAIVVLLSPPPTARADDVEDARAIVFSGRDVWLNGAFLNGGVLWSPTALDDDGLLFKFLLSGGLYRYNAGDLGGERVDRQHVLRPRRLRLEGARYVLRRT